MTWVLIAIVLLLAAGLTGVYGAIMGLNRRIDELERDFDRQHPIDDHSTATQVIPRVWGDLNRDGRRS